MSGESFISRESMIKHKEYMKSLNLAYSVLEKSEGGLSGLSSREILRAKIGAQLKKEAYRLKREIELHELYFRSFDMYSLPKIRSAKEASCLIKLFYSVKAVLKERENPKFLCFYRNRRGEMEFDIVESYSVLPSYNEIGAIDLFEHAYIFDYGYKREKYLEEAFRFINFTEE